MAKISFKSSYIMPAKVLQKNSIGFFRSQEVSFVKLEKSHGLDQKLLSELNNQWKCDFIKFIRCDFLSPCDNSDIYALTTQKDSFERLEPEKILGLAEAENLNNEYSNLYFLQTNPLYAHGSQSRNFKRVGTAFLDSFKQLFQHPIVLNALENLEHFYEDNGFVLVDNDDTFVWAPKPFDKQEMLNKIHDLDNLDWLV